MSKKSNAYNKQNLDIKILRVLYTYYQAHPGNPKMTLNDLI